MLKLVAILAMSAALFAATSSCRKISPHPDMAIVNDALQQYCTSEGLSADDFNAPQIHSETQCDWCVEFTTRTNRQERHVLLLFFKGGRIVERQRLIEPMPPIPSTL